MRLSCSGSYSNLVELTRVISSRNPYLSIGAVQVSASPRAPSQHQISLDLRWPIWADQRIEEELRQQYEARGSAEKEQDES